MAQKCRNPNVVGYYIDDGWAADAANNPHGPSEVDGNWKADMVSKTELFPTTFHIHFRQE